MKTFKVSTREKTHKEKQLDIIRQSNPMMDDIHTGIRDIDDIKTLNQVINDPSEEFYGAPDFTRDMAEKAVNDSSITVYSSKPIENGVFVTPSKMEAQNYAGNGEIYSKEVNPLDIAWIDSIEGQYAKVNESAAGEK